MYKSIGKFPIKLKLDIFYKRVIIDIMNRVFLEIIVMFCAYTSVIPISVCITNAKKHLWFFKWDTRTWYQSWIDKGEDICDPTYEGWDKCWGFRSEFQYFPKDKVHLIRKVPLYIRLDLYLKNVYYRLRFFVWFAIGLIMGHFLK